MELGYNLLESKRRLRRKAVGGPCKKGLVLMITTLFVVLFLMAIAISAAKILCALFKVAFSLLAVPFTILAVIGSILWVGLPALIVAVPLLAIGFVLGAATGGEKTA